MAMARSKKVYNPYTLTLDFGDTVFKNFRSLAGLDMKLGQTWSKNGQNMTLTWSKKVDIP